MEYPSPAPNPNQTDEQAPSSFPQRNQVPVIPPTMTSARQPGRLSRRDLLLSLLLVAINAIVLAIFIWFASLPAGNEPFPLSVGYFFPYFPLLILPSSFLYGYFTRFRSAKLVFIVSLLLVFLSALGISLLDLFGQRLGGISQKNFSEIGYLLAPPPIFALIAGIASAAGNKSKGKPGRWFFGSLILLILFMLYILTVVFRL